MDAVAAAQEATSTFDPNDKYIGLALAVSSSIAIGTSFIITKKVRLCGSGRRDTAQGSARPEETRTDSLLLFGVDDRDSSAPPTSTMASRASPTRT